MEMICLSDIGGMMVTFIPCRGYQMKHKRERSTLEVMAEKKIGTSRKDFKKMNQRLPCYMCVVLAACKAKPKIECDLLLNYTKMCEAYGSNTLLISYDLVKIFPNAQSFNGTMIL